MRSHSSQQLVYVGRELLNTSLNRAALRQRSNREPERLERSRHTIVITTGTSFGIPGRKEQEVRSQQYGRDPLSDYTDAERGISDPQLAARSL